MIETLVMQSSTWVHLAATLYILGFWARDQLHLRLFVLIGTVFYITYYYHAADTPLWSALIWSSLLGVVNLYVTIQLALERTTFRMSQDERRLYGAFSTMTPGEFRKLAEIGIWHKPGKRALLTEENEPNQSLFYIVQGQVTLQKRGQSFAMNAGAFVGEVSYLLKSAATATAYADEQAQYVEWRHEDLINLEKRHQGIRIALREMLNADLAAKVADGNGASCSCLTSEGAPEGGDMRPLGREAVCCGAD